ncbi:hypothetical protein ACBQ54_01960 [Providencia vermicola]
MLVAPYQPFARSETDHGQTKAHRLCAQSMVKLIKKGFPDL